VIDMINLDHLVVDGPGVRYVDLTDPTDGFGTNPIDDNYLEETRLYGWPHASGSGQGRIASEARTVLTTGEW